MSAQLPRYSTVSSFVSNGGFKFCFKRHIIYSLLMHLQCNLQTMKNDVRIKYFPGYTPLILAVLGGHLSCVKMLVAGGAHVDQSDGRSGRTALHHAVEADNVAIAGYLLLEVCIIDNIVHHCSWYYQK